MTDQPTESPRQTVLVRNMLRHHNQLAAEIAKDIDAIGSVYKSIGDAMYDEPRTRLAQRIAFKICDGTYQPPPAEVQGEVEEAG